MVTVRLADGTTSAGFEDLAAGPGSPRVGPTDTLGSRGNLAIGYKALGRDADADRLEAKEPPRQEK